MPGVIPQRERLDEGQEKKLKPSEAGIEQKVSRRSVVGVSEIIKKGSLDEDGPEMRAC